MTTATVPPFTLAIEEAFAFQGGVTVLVGHLIAGSPPLLAPCQAELVVDGELRATIQLDSERMPGPDRKGLRAVETKANIRIEELRDRTCVLVHH